MHGAGARCHELGPLAFHGAHRAGTDRIIDANLALEFTAIVEAAHDIVVGKPARLRVFFVHLERGHVELLNPRGIDELLMDEELGAGLGELQRILLHKRIAFVGFVRILVERKRLPVIDHPVVEDLDATGLGRKAVLDPVERELFGHIEPHQPIVGDERIDRDARKRLVVGIEHGLDELATGLRQVLIAT